MAPKTDFGLPLAVNSPSEVSRLLNELTTIDDTLLQLGIRSGGTPTHLPKASRLLEKLAEHNKLNLLRDEERAQLKQYLARVNQKAPRLHFSFSNEPAPAFLEKLVAWLREQVDPHILVTVGLQPSIGAGCVLRTTNRQFDFSLGRYLVNQRPLLLKSIEMPNP